MGTGRNDEGFMELSAADDDTELVWAGSNAGNEIVFAVAGIATSIGISALLRQECVGMDREGECEDMAVMGAGIIICTVCSLIFRCEYIFVF